MTQKEFTVEGRQFRTQSDYARALHDKKITDRLRSSTDWNSREQLEKLLKELEEGRYQFFTLLGTDFQEEVRETLQRQPAGSAGRRRLSAKRKPQAGAGDAKKSAGKLPDISGDGQQSSALRREGRNASGKSGTTVRSAQGMPVGKSGTASRNAQGHPAGKSGMSAGRKGSAEVSGKQTASDGLSDIVRQELAKREKRRRLTIALCSAVAVICLGYFGLYSWYIYRTDQRNQALSSLKTQTAESVPEKKEQESAPQFTPDGETEEKEVLDEYKNLLNKNKKLIGWLKIDDTNIDFPVVQTTDNEYYLTHNMNQEYDRNGTIFMDKDCDVLKPSTNYILYGHHMKSGKMFGTLDRYEDQSYFEKHRYIQFDTIYEKGSYEVMYVFRSRVYSEEEIVFKYYQFIDADGEQEFNSYMEEMASMTLYDTGVTAEYGDQLLTLSTCDSQEKNGRFVVVAKRIKE